MPKLNPVIALILKILMWVAIIIGIPAVINFFGQPKFGVFDGITSFFQRVSLPVFVLVFAAVALARKFIKKQKPEILKGIAVYLITLFAATVVFSSIGIHDFARMYLILLAAYAVYYYFDNLPALFEKIKKIPGSLGPKWNGFFRWTGRVIAVLIAPLFMFLAFGREESGERSANFLAGMAVVFFITQALWRRFVKKVKFDLLLSFSVFIVTGFLCILLRGLLVKLKFMNFMVVSYFVILAATWAASREEKTRETVIKGWNFLWEKIRPVAEKIFRAAAELAGKYTKKSAEKVKQVKNKRVKLAIGAGIIVAAIVLFNVGRFIYDRAFVTVTALSPKGEVSENILITAEFSKPVDLRVKDVNDLRCFTIKPELKGKYSFENKKTVIFSPEEPLLPSTDYTVTMNPGMFFSAPGQRVIGSPSTTFHTPYMKIVDSRFFVNKDILKNEEKEVVGEINFNYPVMIETLKSAVSVKKAIYAKCNRMAKNESNMEFTVEPSENPSRFYIKIPNISRNYDCQEINVKIAKGIKCPTCDKGLESDFEQAVNISQKIKLAVENLSPWQAEGETQVAIRFNMPVTAEQVKKYVTVVRRAQVNKPAAEVPYTVKVEYCYAVLTGDFEPNLYYDVSVAGGMASKTGEPMAAPYSSSVRVEDLPSSIDYAEEGEILTPAGDMNVALRVMNIDRINVKLIKVFKNNLVYYLRYQNYSEYGQQVYSGYHDIKGGKINSEITEYINFSNFTKEPYKGIFIAEVSNSNNYWDVRRKVIRCTDLGMIAKASGKDLMVKVISINTLAPAANITVKLMSTTNQVMKELKTDAAGRALFPNWRQGMYNFQPYLLMAEDGEDFSYLVFDNSMLDNYRFDTGGEPSLTDGMKAFLTSDRGLYRPGETVNLTTIVRNNDMSLPPAVIVEHRITGPQGETVQSEKKELNDSGMAVFSLKLPLSAMTGEYRSEIRINNDRVIGNTSFKVEEFIPDKLEVSIKSETPEMQAGSPLLFTVQANQMFGAPAAGNRVETEVNYVDYTFESKKYKDYIFRDPQKSFSQRTERLGSEKLDGLGRFAYEVPLPDKANPPSALMAEIYTNVYDDGGRPVSAYKSIPIHVYKYYLGVKLKDPRKIYKRGDTVELDIAAINSDDQPQKVKNVEIIVKRRVWYSIFRANRWNRQMYDSSYYEEAIVYKSMNINGEATLSFDADVEGEYYVYVGNEERMRTGTTIRVSGPGFTTYDMSNAEKITISTDKDKYKAGETATVTIKAPFDGMAYVTLERDKVYMEKYVQVVNGGAVIMIPVTAEFLPNVYLNVVAVRKPDERYMSLPFAAYGIQNISVDKAAKDLKPDFNCSDEVMSTQGINVTLTGLPAGTAAVLAAVDEGILQIIRFETPDPLSFFYMKKAMETFTYTIFNKLLTDVKAKKAAIGGDYEMAPMQKHLNPIIAKNVESYAKFSGIVYANENGTINYKFDTKKFNGKVRVMVFAVKGDKFASTQKKVNVVDPIVITPTLPRFLAPGDEFYMPVRVYNNTHTDSAFEVKVDIDGPVSIEKNSQAAELIKNKGEQIFTFRGRAKEDAGRTVFNITASGANETLSVARELAVRPASHLETKVYRGSLEAGKEMKFDVPANYIKQGKRAKVFLSYSRAAEFAGAFDYLINYPYGCVEQTTSSAFPLIYYKELGIARQLLEYQGINLDTYVNETIKRLQKFVLPGNRITFWPGSYYEASDWTKLYVAHFLIEAKRKDYYVPDDLYSAVLAAAGLADNGQVVVQQQEEQQQEGNYEGEGEGSYEGEGEEGEYDSPTTYEIQEGDSLPNIAARNEVYGDSRMWPLLFDANRDKIDNYNDELPYGEKLIIPRNVSEVEIEAAKERADELGAPVTPRLDRSSMNTGVYNFENNIYKLYLKTLLNRPDDNTMKYYEDLFTLYVKKKLKNEKVLKELGYTIDKIKNMENSLEKEYLLKGGLVVKTAADFGNGLTETDRFLLSMSYAQYNKPEAARMVIFDDFKSKYMVRELNGFFNSYSRNLGMYLSALTMAEGKATARTEFNENLLLKELKEDGSFGSTQETAWALIGLAGAAKVRGKGEPINADIYINGELAKTTAGKESLVLNDAANSWKSVRIVGKGGPKFYYNVFVEGTPKAKNTKSLSKGLKISRKYYDEEGREANLTNVVQGKLIVVSVTLEPQAGRALDNVVVVDLLPAGFEIENPRLKTRGSLKFTPESNFSAVYEDIRDDRMLMFTSAFSSPMTFSYTVRAVTPGKYVIPNAYAEAMYDPDVKAESYEGEYLVVVPGKF